MISNGYAGKILWVDLTKHKTWEETSERYSEWIGGRGLGAYLLSQRKELFSAEAADQPIIISAGPFVGSGYPVGTRTAVSARNQLSGGISFSNVGGDFGTRFKMSGYDAAVILGASEKPVIILTRNGKAEIIACDDLWGKQISPLREALQGKLETDRMSFIGIGPAGENLAAVSCLMVDEAHAAGWGGSGAIFGAKRLKALVAVGDVPVKVFATEGVQRKARELEWRIHTSEAMAGMVRGGTHGMAGAGGFSRLVPTGVKNLTDEYLSPEESEPIREETFRQWQVERSGCFGCLVQCLHRYIMPSTPYGRLEAEGMHANSVRGLASNLGVDDPATLLMLHRLCNEYGMDTDGVSSSVAFALECAENEIIPREQPGGVILEWGNGPALVKLVTQMAERQGLGAVLSRGVRQASAEFGGQSERYAMMTKGVGINEQGIRSHRGWALGIITSNRGGGHLGGSPQTENRRVSAELGERALHLRTAGDPGAYDGKGKLVAYTEKMKAVVDSLGLCYFVFAWYDISIGSIDELAEMLYLATGRRMSGSDLLRHGQRCVTLERTLNYRLAGFTRLDDQVPERFYELPVGDGPYKGAHLDHEKVEAALDEYYETLGWDVSTGLPKQETLTRLGLDFLTEK